MVPDKYKLDQAELLARLRAVELFDPLSDEQIVKLSRAMVETDYKQGKNVFWQGESDKEMCVILLAERPHARTHGYNMHMFGSARASSCARHVRGICIAGT